MQRSENTLKCGGKIHTSSRHPKHAFPRVSSVRSDVFVLHHTQKPHPSHDSHTTRRGGPTNTTSSTQRNTSDHSHSTQPQLYRTPTHTHTHTHTHTTIDNGSSAFSSVQCPKVHRSVLWGTVSLPLRQGTAFTVSDGRRFDLSIPKTLRNRYQGTSPIQTACSGASVQPSVQLLPLQQTSLPERFVP